MKTQEFWQLSKSKNIYYLCKIDDTRKQIACSPSRQAILAVMRLFGANNIHDWTSGDNWSSKLRTLEEVPMIEDTSKLPQWIANPKPTRRICIFVEENALESLEPYDYII